MREVRSASEEETHGTGAELARELQRGDIIALCGDLGAGKTAFAKGIVAGLGSSATVSSPTFTLVHEYNDGPAPICHLDFYRLESEDEILALGWDEIIAGGAIVIVEWADRYPALFPAGTRWIRMESSRDDPGVRQIRSADPPIRPA